MDTLARLGFDLERNPNIKLDLDDRPQKSPRACVIPSDPPKSRPPDHARAGRPPRLPGLPARGRARAPLRGLRPGAAVHVPQHLARPRADGDLFVHRRGDLARAGLARALLRALRRGGRRERRGDDLHGGAALPPLLAEVPLRARLLGPLRRGRRHPRRLLGAPDRRDGRPLPRDGYLADMDAGFYSADYLRAWIRSAQLRAYLEREIGDDWWASARRASACARSSARAPGR